MATKFGIGASGYFGATGMWSAPCSALSSAVTGPAKASFNRRVKRSCSGMKNQLLAVGSWLLAKAIPIWLKAKSYRLRATVSSYKSYIRFIARLAQHGRNGQE